MPFQVQSPKVTGLSLSGSQYGFEPGWLITALHRDQEAPTLFWQMFRAGCCVGAFLQQCSAIQKENHPLWSSLVDGFTVHSGLRVEIGPPVGLHHKHCVF